MKVSFDDDSEAKYIKALDPAESRHKSFIWYDLVRKEFLDLYLGEKISSAFPLADFSDMPNSQDYILIVFGLNAYLTLLTNLGRNMALEYQSFQFRAKVWSDPDSAIMLGTEH